MENKTGMNGKKEFKERRLRPPHIGLVTQLIIKSVIFFTILLGVVDFLIFNYQKTSITNKIIEKNMQFVATYASFMSDARAAGDDLVIVDYIERMKSSPMIRYIMVLDNRSCTIFHSDMRKVGKTFQDAASLRSVASDTADRQELLYEGERIIDYFAPITVSHKKAATLRIGMARSDIDAGVEEIKENLSVITVAGIIIVIVGSFILNSGIGVGINRLKTACKIVMRGELPESINVKGSGEIGYLARVLERMFEKFREDLTQLEAQKKELRKGYGFFIQSISEFLPDGVIILDDENRLIYANTSAAKMVGFSVLGCIGKHMLEVIRNAELIEFLNYSSQKPNESAARDIISLGCNCAVRVVKDMTTGDPLGTIIQFKTEERNA